MFKIWILSTLVSFLILKGVSVIKKIQKIRRLKRIKRLKILIRLMRLSRLLLVFARDTLVKWTLKNEFSIKF